MSTGKDQLPAEALPWAADILMAAAHADGSVTDTETNAVERILRDLCEADELSPGITDRLQRFDPQSFDLQTVCDQLDLRTGEQRRALLLAIAEVTEADDEHDLDESAFIRRVAISIGATPEEYRDLTVEILSTAAARPQPPPPPPSKAPRSKP